MNEMQMWNNLTRAAVIKRQMAELAAELKALETPVREAALEGTFNMDPQNLATAGVERVEVRDGYERVTFNSQWLDVYAEANEEFAAAVAEAKARKVTNVKPAAAIVYMK